REPAAVAIVEVTVLLVVSAEADVVAETTIRRCAARFNLGLMVEGRRTDTAGERTVAGIRTSLEDLVDEARGTSRRVRGRATAGVNLQFLQTEARFRRCVVVVKCTVHRNTVVFKAGEERLVATHVR